MTVKTVQMQSRQTHGRKDDWSTIIGRQLFEKNQKILVDSDREFEALVEQASANKALARILPVTDGTSSSLRQRVAVAKTKQEERLREALELLDATQKICLELNVPYAVMKSFDALPDLGHDVDLLVGDNVGLVRDRLLKKFQCDPITLTFCDRQAGKFSTFIEGFTFDFELYAKISQMGEQYYSEKTVLENRVQERVFNSQTYLCSREDRLLITCIHTIYRHGKIRLSDLNIAHEAFLGGVNVDYVLRTVELAGIQKGFALFITVLEKAGLNLTGQTSIPREIRAYSSKVLRSDRLLEWNAQRLVYKYPLKLPIMLSILLFLYKAPQDMARHKFASSLRSATATVILAIDKALPLRFQKAIAVRIW